MKPSLDTPLLELYRQLADALKVEELLFSLLFVPEVFLYSRG